MQHKSLIGIAAAMGIALATPHAAFAAEKFECPELAKLGSAGQETLAKELVPDPMALDDVEVLTRTVPMFREHRFSNLDTVNYISGIFCPVIRADKNLSEAQKIEKASAFSSVVSDIVYRQSPNGS